jgi:hypothetical protein
MAMRSLAGITLACSLSACAIHPLPQDVTGLSTQLIVRQIRCESRKAIIDTGFDWLNSRSEFEPYIKDILMQFLDPNNLPKFHYNLFKGETRRVLQLFFDTGIAYNYKLTMTEANGLTGGLSLIQPFVRGMETLGIAGGGTLQRQNLRTFTITDSFSKLIQELPERDCTDNIASANFVYPIAGRIGMMEVVKDFVDLTLFDNLGGTDTNGQGPPTLVDSLNFQTTFSVNGGPSFVFTPRGRGLNLASASLGPSASRSDMHNLTVGLALPRTQQRLAEALRGTGVTPLLISARGGPSELAAANAVNQVIAQRALNPFFLLTP